MLFLNASEGFFQNHTALYNNIFMNNLFPAVYRIARAILLVWMIINGNKVIFVLRTVKFRFL